LLGCSPSLRRNVIAHLPPFFFSFFNAFLKASSSRTLAYALMDRLNFCPWKTSRARQLRMVTATIIANTTNANVPDGVFIAPAGLTPGVLIGKHKIKIAAWRASSRTKSEADRMWLRDPRVLIL